MDDADHDDDDELVAAAIGVVGLWLVRRARGRIRRRQHDSVLAGRAYTREIMRTRNVNRFLAVNRMNKETFLQLKRLLTGEKGKLKEQRTISSEEKIMIFLQALKGLSVRVICERFQHSSSTISLIVHDVMRSMLKCESQLFSKLDANTPLSDIIRGNRKFYPFFSNCDGALDGTHIPAVVKFAEQGVFRNRKKFVSQNVLGVCNFHAIFIYALTGWEGSAHDSRVLNDAKLKGLPLRPGKFYLGDAGYALSKYVLTPYRGTRYHLLEWCQGQNRPKNKEELFNLRHSSLRNVVERIFGIMKKRFPILVSMPSYPFISQCDLIYCAMMTHNFIRMNALFDDIFDEWIEPVQLPQDLPEVIDGDVAELNTWRDSIALAMWNAYLVELAARGIALTN